MPSTSTRPVRKGGTTRFEAATASAVPAVSTRAPRKRHPDFDRLRLVKSDTDGYEPVVVPARGSRELGYTFWDVAARRADDDAAAAAFDALMPVSFALDGVGR